MWWSLSERNDGSWDCESCTATQRVAHGYYQPRRAPLDLRIPVLLYRCPGRALPAAAWEDYRAALELRRGLLPHHEPTIRQRECLSVVEDAEDEMSRFKKADHDGA